MKVFIQFETRDTENVLLENYIPSYVGCDDYDAFAHPSYIKHNNVLYQVNHVIELDEHNEEIDLFDADYDIKNIASIYYLCEVINNFINYEIEKRDLYIEPYADSCVIYCDSKFVKYNKSDFNDKDLAYIITDIIKVKQNTHNIIINPTGIGMYYLDVFDKSGIEYNLMKIEDDI